MSVNIIPPPVSDPIARKARKKFTDKKQADPEENLVGQEWIEFFSAQGLVLAAANVQVNSAAAANQTASIGATDLSGGTLAAGLYSLSWYAAIITPASVSSSLQVTVDWTDRGQAKSYTGSAITGNTAATVEVDKQLVIRIDSGSPVRYSAVYGSVGTAMTYDLVVVLSAAGA